LHAKEDFESVALQHLFDARWEEVIRLGVGYMALVQKRPRAAQLFVKKVLFEHEEPEPRAWFTKVLKKQVPLAALLAAEAGDALPDALQQRVAEEMAAWVAVMPREIVVPVLEELALTDFAPRVAMACKSRLESKNSKTRARIATALGDLRAVGVEEALIIALSDEDLWVRSAAERSLQAFLSKELLQKLEPRLSDTSPQIRTSTIKVLAPWGMDLSETLLQSILQDTDATVRAAAVCVLKHRSHAEATKAACTIQLDQSSEVRGALSEVLAHFMEKDLLRILICDENQELRQSTTLALLFAMMRTKNPLADVLEASSDDSISKIGKSITSEWHSTEQHLINVRSSDWRIRARAAIGLQGVEGTLAPLADLYNDTFAEVRRSAIVALGSVPSQHAIDVCLEALRDADAGVRSAAAVALAHHKRNEALAPLLEMFLSNEAERFHAAYGLGNLGAKEALEPLMAAANDPREQELYGIYGALGKLASSNEAARLASYLDAHEQPSDHSDHIFTALWAIATRESRGPADPTA
jgi:HEAT repeat protein